MGVRAGSARRRRRPAWSLLLTIGLTGLYATGIGGRPTGSAWVYDVVLFNLPYLAAAGACFAAAARVPTERIAWSGLGFALVISATGNALRVLGSGLPGNGTVPLAATVLSLAGYVIFYVPVIGLIRARVPRFHPSMWLDGLIGALGSLSVGFAFLLGPYLGSDGGHAAIALSDLVGPTTDVLLLAVLVAVGSILGVRLDRTLLTMAAGLVCVCASDIVLFVLQVQGRYIPGGPLELGWLAGVVVAAVAATGARERPAPVDNRGGSRLGWRLLAVPLACTVTSLFVLGYGWFHRMHVVCAWLAIACVLAGIGRIAVTFREVRSFNELRQEARTDELTGLANRRALLHHAKGIVASADDDEPASLLLLDLDGFKEVNDSLGHAAGDDLLSQVGPRLAPVLRGDDVLARLGGDEFAVLAPATDADEAQALARRLRELLLQPFTIEGIRLHVGVSIGVASTSAVSASMPELLRCADIAMYTAKNGREGVRLYVPDSTTSPSGEDRLHTMEELRTALTDGGLLIHLQPQVALRDGSVVGAEALVRWRHPTRGLLSPADLLPAAEHAGLLRPLTETVLELALAAAARWWPDHQVPVSVNLSAANVTDLDLTSKVATALRAHGLPTRALTLELVEDTLMGDPDRGRAVLADFRRLGIRTSIDDYGTGYSSLAYLRNLPADELKLDRSLTVDVNHDPRAMAIVQHTVALAHALGLTLVAEGVEDDDTRTALARLGCDVVQGYALARPMPVEEFLVWLPANDRRLLEETPV